MEKPIKVLVAEDEEMMLKALKFRLEKDGYEVITALDGREAVEQIKKASPALVVTDIMMPFVSGLEVVSMVKQELEMPIPVIVLSAVGLETTVLEAFELGADDFVTKPFSMNELSMRVKKLLMRKKQS